MNGVSSRRTGGGRRLAATFAALLLAMVPVAFPALAGSFQVDPVSIELLPGRRSTALTVRNAGAEPVSVRVHLYRWTQQNGEDVYSETDELIASPPIFTIGPNATQLVRVGPRRRTATGAYRVVLEEIPGARQDGTGIRVSLRLDLPLYIIGERAARPALSWSAWRDRGGEVILEARNDGSRHSQILRIGSRDSGGREMTLSSQMGVVLPGGSRKRWNVGPRPELSVGSELLLAIRDGNGETSQSRIVLERR